jgi:hypothetical protein
MGVFAERIPVDYVVRTVVHVLFVESTLVAMVAGMVVNTDADSPLPISYQPQTAGLGDISGGYGYNQAMPQQMPLRQMTSTQSTVIVRTKIKFLKMNPALDP